MANYTKREERRKDMLDGVERGRANPPKEWTPPPCACGAPGLYASGSGRGTIFECTLHAMERLRDVEAELRARK
jgi:hypothetical protein